ncbi:MAG: HNH endonuclease [Proteobacteria bacterium]|nr:HNH endonuclease [Pseudomonadota bacterium]
MSSKAKPDTVKHTGAKAGDILVGREKKNQGLRIRVHSSQKEVGTRIEGGFELLDAGNGDYASSMSEFTGHQFENARQLIDLIKTKPAGKRCKFILGRDMLRIEAPTGLSAEAEFPEGKEFERKHKARERSQVVIRLAKENFRQKNNGQLCCEVCYFSFHSVYGQIGSDYIEGHHLLPLSELDGRRKTRVEDIALVCSNCHRMLHRRRPWLGVSELKKLLA